jgi:MFS family permease
MPLKRSGLMSAPSLVLGLLCLMYFITYVNRQNMATAGGDIIRDLHLTRGQLGQVIGSFGVTYAIFQILGGWLGDRWGARRTLFVCGIVWAGATALTGLVEGLMSLYLVRLVLGVGEGATFPVATRAMQSWVPAERRGFAQGFTHAFSRIGNSVTPLIVAWLLAPTLTLFGTNVLALTKSWRRPFVVLGLASLVWVFAWAWYYRDVPADHSGITPDDLAKLPNRGQGATKKQIQVPWGRLVRRMAPITIVYFCYGWTLWMYLNWLPQYFENVYQLDVKKSAIFSSAVFLAGVGGDYLGGVISDRILEKTHDLRKARRDFVIASFLCSFLFMLVVFLTHDLTIIVVSMAAAFFFAELTIGPMWSIPMDIAPKYSGTASGLMNTGSAVAAALSPTAFGYIVDWTGNWQLPFILSLGLLLVGAGLAFKMHPEVAFEDEPAVPAAVRPI